MPSNFGKHATTVILDLSPTLKGRQSGFDSEPRRPSATFAATRIATPQSILKVKRLMSEHTPPQSDNADAAREAQAAEVFSDE